MEQNNPGASVVPGETTAAAVASPHSGEEAACASQADAQLLGSLAEEHKARLIAEADVLRLYNRIRQLQQEGEKAERLIQATRTRAEDARRHRRAKEDEEAAKEARAAKAAEEVERQRRRNMEMKRRQMRARQEVQARLDAQRVAATAEAKEQAAAAEAALESQRRGAREAVAAQREAVQQQQAEGGGKLQQWREQKARAAAGEYEARMQAEAAARLAKEQEIERLAAVEADLIERLRLKQHEQQEAFSQLEAAMSVAGSFAGSGRVRNSLSVCSSRHSVGSTSGSARMCSPTNCLSSRVAATPQVPTIVGSRCSSSKNCRGTAGSSAGSGGGTHAAATAPQPHQCDGRPATQSAVDPRDDLVAREFAVFDPDAVGYIHAADIPALLEALGVHLSQAQLEGAVEQLLDGEGGDMVSFGRFLLFFKG